ncbi:RNA methyltransferase [Desulfovibrio sp. OttesenSCG-928-C06]|nr:RNA methyltransferase [Desulfovibrio sp. OttesenSCG-928-C06]
MATFTEISSPQNPRYKTWLKLLDSRGIKKNEQALVSGRSFIHEIVERYGDRIEAVIVRKKPDEPCGAALLDGLDVPQRCQIFALPSDMFAALDIYGIRGPILQISAPPPPAWNGELPLPRCNDDATNSAASAPRCSMTVFVPFQNPINLGTTIRSAAAFDAGVVLLKEAATPYLPKSLRASGPGIFQVPLFSGPGLEELSRMDLPVFALSPRGRSIYDFDFAKACRLNAGNADIGAGIGLVAGLEGPGLDDYWPEERRISIPMRSCVESLNASVSMSIAMAFFQAGLHRAGLD